MSNADNNTNIPGSPNTPASDVPERKELEDPRSRRFKACNDKSMPLPGDPGNMQALNQPDPGAKTAGLPENKTVAGVDGNIEQNQTTNEMDLLGSDTHAAVYVREDGEEVLLGAIVQDAFKESGAESVKAWNEKSQDERNEAIDAVIEEQGLTPKEDADADAEGEQDSDPKEDVDAEGEQDSDPEEDFGEKEDDGEDAESSEDEAEKDPE